jgi:hypothetical protein
VDWVDPDPLMVMAGAFTELISALLEIEAYAQKAGVTPEQ